MKKERENRLLEGFKQALEHAEGKRELRTTTLPKKPAEMRPEDVVRLREKMNVSQGVMAAALNVSVSTVQSWEQGLKKPGGAALKLMAIAEQQPKILFG
jgi:DNA-binding transcriptional regulator YiaG